MATVTVQHTLFSSAAAAIYPSNAAVEQDAEVIYRNAVQNVRQKPEHRDLSQSLVDRITNARTIEELTQSSGDEINSSRFWRDSSAWRRLGIAVGGFDRMKDPLDMYAQASPSIVLPIYASVCVIATIAREVLGAHESLILFTQRVSSINLQYRRYLLGQEFDEPLRDALTKFYETIIQFCLAAVTLVLRGRAATISRPIIKSIKAPFEKLLAELEETRKQVDSNVSTETYRDVKDIKRTLAQPQYLSTRVCLTATGVQAPIGVPDLLSQQFTGRLSYLRDIHQQLIGSSNTGPAKVAIWGIPGVGKTQLMLRYQHVHHDNYKRSIFVNASSKDSIISAYRTIASTLDLLDVVLAADEMVAEKVKHWLAENAGWLLIFDNVKNVSDVLQLTPKTGKGHLLISTRDYVIAETLAGSDGHLEVLQLPLDEATELALNITIAKRTPSCEELAAAKAVAEFASGLPLAVEQLARLSQSKRLSLSDTLKTVKRKVEVLRLNHPASLHENDFSCGALLMETIDDLSNKDEGAASLFKLLVYLEPSRVPLEILFDAKAKLTEYFARQDTYVHGSISTAPAVSQQNVSKLPKQKFRLDDYDPFELVTYKKLFGIGRHNHKYSSARLPRTDSDEDRRLQQYWTSSKALKDVFASRTAVNHALNILAEAGLIRRLHQSQSVWIHDLFAEMTTAIDQESESSPSNINPHLAGTLVYLSFPVPQIPTPFHIIDKCLLLLPSASRCHKFMEEAGTLNNVTIGAELSHLIASTIHARGMTMATLHSGSLADAIKFYKFALHGYVCAYNYRLQHHPSVSTLQIILATVADHGEQDMYHQYRFNAHLREYRRFGRSAPWRAMQTALKLGNLLMEDGKLDESMSYVNVGVRIAREIFGAGHTETVDALGLLLQVREAREEWKDAYDVALNRAKAFMGWEEKLGKYTGKRGLVDSVQGATLARDLGDAATRIGKKREAERWYELALMGIQASYGQESPEADFARRKLVDLRIQNGL